MSPETVFALLLIATIAWIAIPFIPALSELLRPRDAAPLASVGQDSGLLTYFATSFTERVTNEGLLGTTPPAWLSDGSAVRVHSAQTPIAPERGGTSDVVLVTDETPVPPGVNIAAELFAREVFRGGANGTYRAILGQRDVRLGAGSTVQRWVHANGSLAAATGTRLLGRATSDVSIVLEGGVQFDRLDAPVVRVGDGSAETQILPVSAYSPFLPGNAMVLGPGYWRVTGDLTIPAGASLVGSVIVLGNVIVSEGARVEGSIKARGTLQVRARAVVVGALASRREITIGNGARVSGPVIAETSVAVGAATVGSAGSRTTVTAPQVELRSGATVYGAVMSADGGVSRAA
jgi:cytoskeletal protein CcmA (bactofilin family)